MDQNTNRVVHTHTHARAKVSPRAHNYPAFIVVMSQLWNPSWLLLLCPLMCVCFYIPVMPRCVFTAADDTHTHTRGAARVPMVMRWVWVWLSEDQNINISVSHRHVLFYPECRWCVRTFSCFHFLFLREVKSPTTRGRGEPFSRRALSAKGGGGATKPVKMADRRTAPFGLLWRRKFIFILF